MAVTLQQGARQERSERFLVGSTFALQKSADGIVTIDVVGGGAPSAHASTHHSGGADPLALGSIAGTLVSGQVPPGVVTQHQAALSILETQVVDGALLARVGGNETISGAWTFSSQVKAAAGTIAAPGYGFSADVDTGIHLSAVGQLGLVAAGSQVVTIESAGVAVTVGLIIGSAGALLLPAGSASAPSARFSGDVDTGLFSVGANVLGLTAGGAAIAHATASGLRVVDGSASAPAYAFIGDTNTGVYLIGADSLGIAVGGGAVAQLSGTGLSLFTGKRLDLPDDSGSGALRIGGTKILGDQVTGWALPTGAPSRATFNTATVSTETLAQVVYALLQDLHGGAGGTNKHGLLGP